MAETPYYDLMVLLDPDSPEGSRTQVIDQVRSQVSGGDGALKGDADWGLRRLAYEIDHRPEAYYHLFQFQAKPNLLETLDRNLSIEDAVLRHRIIRLDDEPPAETPKPEPTAIPASEAPPVEAEAPAAVEGEQAPAPAEAEAGAPDEAAPEAAAETPAAEAAAAETAPAPAEPAAEAVPAPAPEAPAEPAAEAPAEAPEAPAAAPEAPAPAEAEAPESPPAEQ